ncbi:MAG: hypothetical protein ACP5HG_15225, partial [Anaerolineae bacterium]
SRAVAFEYTVHSYVIPNGSTGHRCVPTITVRDLAPRRFARIRSTRSFTGEAPERGYLPNPFGMTAVPGRKTACDHPDEFSLCPCIPGDMW